MQKQSERILSMSTLGDCYSYWHYEHDSKTMHRLNGLNCDESPVVVFAALQIDSGNIGACTEAGANRRCA